MPALALALVLMLGLPVPPSAETIAHWKSVWTQRVITEYTPELLGEWNWMAISYSASFPVSEFPQEIERWRGVVAAYFPPARVDDALRVMECESEPNGDPRSKNRSSTAAGLFQFLRSTWDWVAIPLGYQSYATGAVYHPAANIHAAAVLSSGGSNWRAWRASMSCHGLP